MLTDDKANLSPAAPSAVEEVLNESRASETWPQKTKVVSEVLALDLAKRLQVQEAVADRLRISWREDTAAEKERAEQFQKLWDESADHAESAEAALNRARELLREVVEWKNSETVQASFKRAAGLTLTHPHLGVPVSQEFSANAAAMWERIQKELSERG